MPDELTTISTNAITTAATAAIDHVAFCELRIAEDGHVVQLPPKPWAGRDEVVAACMAKFGIDPALAGTAVDIAVSNLWIRRDEDPRNFLKQTMMLRLKQIRQLILTYCKNPRREETYEYQATNDANVVREVKIKEKRYTGVDMSAVRMLLEVERLIAELYSLTEADDAAAIQGVHTFIEGLEGLARINARQEKDRLEAERSSPAIRAKNRTLTEVKTPDEVRMLESILTPEVKAVPVKVENVKRPRGRPPKVKPDVVVEIIESPDERSNSEDVHSGASEEKVAQDEEQE